MNYLPLGRSRLGNSRSPMWRTLLLLVLGSVTWPAMAVVASGNVKEAGSSAYSGPVPNPISYASTGVAAAHDMLKLSGAGLKIAIMDSGINWQHPAFGGCSQLGASGTCRVVKGWDFVGNLESGKYRPDSDPMDCRSAEGSHGTQVASVAAGDASYHKNRPWRGVAYGASILAYKVSGSCEHHGSVSTNATLAAITKAAEDGADVLNLSYGDFRSGGYADRRYVVALGSAMRSGALVAIASGNDGEFGPWFTEGGVAAPGVISTAAVDVSVTVGAAALTVNPPLDVNGTQQGTLRPIIPSILTSASLDSMPRLVAQYEALKFPLEIKVAKPVNGCLPLTNTAELRGRIALLLRGNCTFAEKASRAAAAGAAAAVIYNNATGLWLSLAFDEIPALPTWGITYAEGAAVREAAESSGASISAVSWQGGKAGKYKLVVEPSVFSSWGPSATLEMNPSIAAPGSSIFTASMGNNYTEVDGTSYSAPFVSGALALWRQARPEHWANTKVTQEGSKATHIESSSSSSSRSNKVSKGAVSTAEATAGGNGAANIGSASLRSWMAKRVRSYLQIRWQSGSAGVAVASPQPQQQQQLSVAATAGSPQPQQQQLSAAATAAAAVAAVKGRAGQGGRRLLSGQSTASAAATVPANMFLADSVKDVQHAAANKPVAPQQAAAYAAFVSTAQPVDWMKQEGWAQPVARVGAGLIQVDAAIQSPIRTEPTHLLLHSNSPSQTQTVIFTNAGASYPITYKLGHRPAAAVSLRDTWFILNPEDLMHAVAASVEYSVNGQTASEVVLNAGDGVSVQVTFTLPKELQDQPYIYSGYITATPAQTPPSNINTEQGTPQWDSDTKQLKSAGGFTGALPFRPVPLVVPYQGFSKNYTELPLLPQPNMDKFPQLSKEGLKSLLRVCYADFAQDVNSEDFVSGAPINQDGLLFQPHVDRCVYNAADPAAEYRLPLADIQEGYGVLMVSAALTRPAVQMQLMLFEADACGDEIRAHAECAGGYKRGKLVGEVWQYKQPSRDFPTTLWSYYSYEFDGQVTLRDATSDKVTGKQAVKIGKPYKFQLWLVGPVAAADKAAGEQYKVWKHDSPGTYVFS